MKTERLFDRRAVNETVISMNKRRFRCTRDGVSSPWELDLGDWVRCVAGVAEITDTKNLRLLQQLLAMAVGHEVQLGDTFFERIA